MMLAEDRATWAAASACPPATAAPPRPAMPLGADFVAGGAPPPPPAPDGFAGLGIQDMLAGQKK